MDVWVRRVAVHEGLVHILGFSKTSFFLHIAELAIGDVVSQHCATGLEAFPVSAAAPVVTLSIVLNRNCKVNDTRCGHPDSQWIDIFMPAVNRLGLDWLVSFWSRFGSSLEARRIPFQLLLIVLTVCRSMNLLHCLAARVSGFHADPHQAFGSPASPKANLHLFTRVAIHHECARHCRPISVMQIAGDCDAILVAVKICPHIISKAA